MIVERSLFKGFIGINSCVLPVLQTIDSFLFFKH